MMANRRSLDRPSGGGLVSHLAGRGFRVYALDFRGHGESGPGADRGANWSYDDLVSLDLPAAVRAVRERHPGEPLAIVGHSLAAHATLAALGRHPDLEVRAVVALGGNVWMRRLEADRGRWRAKQVALAGLAAAAGLFGRVPARLFGQGSDDEARDYADQLVGWGRRDRWTSRDGFDYLAAMPSIRVPVLAVAGSGDLLLCHPESSAAFHAHLTGTSVDTMVSTEGEPGHMDLVLSSRLGRDRDRIADWIAATIA